MTSICGIDCSNCRIKERCKGCTETNGYPFGKECIAARCYKHGGKDAFCKYKNQLISEFNALGIPDMPQITELCVLYGAYVNLEYPLSNGEKIKLLKDNDLYLGYQVEKKNSNRCYGLVADDGYLLVCEYGCNGSDPQIVAYKRRFSQREETSHT